MRAVIFKGGRVTSSVGSTTIDPIWTKAQNEGVSRDALILKALQALGDLQRGNLEATVLSKYNLLDTSLLGLVTGEIVKYRTGPTGALPFDKDGFYLWITGKGYPSWYIYDNNKDDWMYRSGPVVSAPVDELVGIISKYLDFDGWFRDVLDDWDGGY